MLRDFWNKLTSRSKADAIEREIEREEDSPEERRFTSQSYEGYESDTHAEEILGGFNPGSLIEDDRPPRDDRP